MRISLVDLSSIFRAAWHGSEHQDISQAYAKSLSRATECVAGYDHAAICVDRPPYKRREIDANYKANREASAAAMLDQLRAVEAALDADGHHIVGAQGYEADDIIATLAAHFAGKAEVTIYSADKDLLQLVGDGVTCVSTATGVAYNSDAVVAKFGVRPELMADLLALTGDSSDNVPGIKGVGPKTAAAWLQEAGSIEAILSGQWQAPEKWREKIAAARDQLATSYRLVTLMDDAPIKPEEILVSKERKAAPEEKAPEIIDEPEETPAPGPQPEQSTALVTTGGEWSKALEPRTPAQAWGIAQAIYRSRMFGDFANPESILAIIMTGRAHGIDAVASLRGMHVIKGKTTMSAQMLVGLVKRSSVCAWFRLVDSTDEQATWETKRVDEPEPTRMSYTIKQAGAAQLTGNDNWRKRPATMLRWRAATELARAVYPDVVSGLYSEEEMSE